METKTKILRNPANGADIINYPISEAQIDLESGEALIDPGTGYPKSTGSTYEWTILKGETLRFPAYVADYLHHIYGFLGVVSEANITKMKEEVKDAAKVSDKILGNSNEENSN